MNTLPEWAGPVGNAWASEWRRTDRSFAGLAPHLDAAIRAAAPSGAGSVADLGCGAGATSLALAAARPDLSITGIDLSPTLVAVARTRMPAGARVDFIHDDVVAALPALAPLDLLISRHGVMFFDDPVAAFAAMRAACAPGAALVFSCFRERCYNPWAEEVATAALGDAPPPTSRAPGPFAFGEEAYLRDVLDRSGWRLDSLQPVDFDYRVGEGADPLADALAFLSWIGPAAPLIRAATGAGAEAIRDRLATLLARRRRDDVIDFPAAAWLVAAHPI